MSETQMIFAQDWSAVDAKNFTERKDPIHGLVTIFHDVVIAREIVQPYEFEGKMLMAYKSADELERYWPWVDGRWAIAGRHPDTPVIVKPGDIAGRTVNPSFVKNLKDTKTGRSNIRGILVDLEVFNDRVAPDTLKGMKLGTLTDVSIGFLYGKEMNPGSWNGTDYDFRQVNMFHDHLAFGIRKGRCSYPACGIGADSLLEAKCLNSACSNRQMKDMESIVGHDPEETEENIRIDNPGVGDCEVTATIQISEDQGIQATYCGESKEVRTYIFSKEKDWTMETAQAWVDEHAEGAGDVFLARLIELDILSKAGDEEEDLPVKQERALKHYGFTEKGWDTLSEETRTALLEVLPAEVEPSIGADMSEEELKAKIIELRQQIDEFYESKAKAADPIDYSAVEPLYAELGAYKEALEELIKERVLDDVAEGDVAVVDEVARSKRLLSDPRLPRESINVHAKTT